MRANHCLAIAVMALLLACSPCWAFYNGGYSVDFATRGATRWNAGGMYILGGSYSGASDGLDGMDGALNTQSLPYWFYAAAYHTNGINGWNSTNGFYDSEMRPYLSRGQTKTEDIYVWAVPDLLPDDIRTQFWSTAFPTHGSFTVKLISVPEGITYTGQRVWELSKFATGEVVLPYYATTDGLTGYHFQAIISAPEPSSVAALFAGLGGLSVLIWRRRAR